MVSKIIADRADTHELDVVDICITIPSSNSCYLSSLRISSLSKNTQNKSFFNVIIYIFDSFVKHYILDYQVAIKEIVYG